VVQAALEELVVEETVGQGQINPLLELQILAAVAEGQILL
jgi:hypothetical protein